MKRMGGRSGALAFFWYMGTRVDGEGGGPGGGGRGGKKRRFVHAGLALHPLTPPSEFEFEFRREAPVRARGPRFAAEGSSRHSAVGKEGLVTTLPTGVVVATQPGLAKRAQMVMAGTVVAFLVAMVAQLLVAVVYAEGDYSAMAT
eukprot:415414-Prorocentrum_minimum.AAC.10